MKRNKNNIHKEVSFVIQVTLLMICLILLTGCETQRELSNTTITNETVENTISTEFDNNQKDVLLDYENETDFENDLNNNKNVKDKVVKFKVKNYAPDSLLGFNAHSGEHLNFISEDDLNLEEGAIVVGKVKSFSKFLGSHIINYDLVLIENSSNINQINYITVKEDTTNKINPPMTSSDASGKNYKEIEFLFKKSGFNNITLKKNFDTIFRSDYSVTNIYINNNNDYYQNDYFDKDIEVVIEYVFSDNTKESSIKSIGKQYDVSQFNADDYDNCYYRNIDQNVIYYFFDDNNKRALCFGVDYGLRSGQYTGELKDGINIKWNDGNETFKIEEEKYYYHDRDSNGQEFEELRFNEKYYLIDLNGNKIECQKLPFYQKDYVIEILKNI